MSIQVAKNQQSTSPGLGGNTQKLDAVVDRNLPDDLDYVSIFNMAIGHKLPICSRYDLYLRYRMKFLGDVVQTQAPQFMDMWLLTINTFNESGVLGIPATRIIRPVYGSHWSMPNHIFGDVTAVGMSAAKSDHDYNYKTYFQIWRENQ